MRRRQRLFRREFSGERVVLGMNDGVLLRCAIEAYAVPLLLFMIGAAIAVSMAPHAAWRDLYGAAGAAAGLTVGLAGLRAVADHNRANQRLWPEILRRA